jgi:hypothetical protein
MYAGAYYHVPILDSSMLGISTLLRLWVPTVATFHPVIRGRYLRSRGGRPGGDSRHRLRL